MDIIKDSAISMIYRFFNIPYISSELKELEKPLLVHISDTPGFIYPFIYRLIKKLEPEVLIHTGDIVDDIKLEFRPGQLNEYSGKIKKIIRKLEETATGEIYLISGNHDDSSIMKKHTQRCRIMQEKSRLDLDKFSFTVCHKYTDEEIDTDFYLFGDNLPEIEKDYEKTAVLNGIPYINIISLKSGNICKMRYPPGTDSARLMMLKIGM